MQLILNELSLLEVPVDRKNGCEKIQEFLECVIKMQYYFKNNSIVVFDEFFSLMVARDYSVHQWLSDKTVEKRLKDKYRSIVNKCQHISSEEYCYSELAVSIGKDKKKSKGCLIAYEMNEHVISLNSNETWAEPEIFGYYFSVLDTYELDDSIKVKIKNISTSLHTLEYEHIAVENIKFNISSAIDLWEKRNIIFPHLIFCDSVKAQLMTDTEKVHIEQIIKKLNILDKYFGNYDGVFDCKKLGNGARNESDSVKNTPKYYNQRVFMTPYGVSEKFFWHISFPGKYPGRIHFIPDKKTGKCIIGYIGKHLPTSKFTTI
ncbi:MAG: hypothetical protein ACERKZ_09650 [Lachnotalea sp.]